MSEEKGALVNGALLVVVAIALLVAGIARRKDLPAPLLLVLVGLVAAAIPGMTDVRLDPDVVLFVVLPPLLFSASMGSSVIGLRQNMRSVGLLAVALPLITTVAVGVVAHLLVPGLPLTSALVLGAVVAPPDAVSATAVGQKLGLPRRLMTLLSGESLLNDATALTSYKVAVAAAIGAGASVLQGLWTFALAVVVGSVVGLVIGYVVDRLRTRLDDPVLESAMGLVVPFAAYLAAEELHGSGVLAVVVAGLLLGQRFTGAGYATRLQDIAVWRAADIVLESVVFLMIGLQLRGIVEALRNEENVWLLLGIGVVLLATVIAARMAVVMGAALAPRVWFDRRSAPTSARAALVISWAGMRGVVSLAAAAAIPLTVQSGAPFPGRDQIMFLTFFIVVGTLLLHGLTLPWLIQRLGIRSDEAKIDAVAEAAAKQRAGQAAIARLDEIVADRAPDDSRVRAAEILRHWAEHRKNEAWERLGRGSDELGEAPSQAFRTLRREMLDSEREVYVSERDSGRIDDDVLNRLQHDLDLEEAMLDRD